MLRNYTRWRVEGDVCLRADLLGVVVDITVDRAAGKVHLDGVVLTPDEARLLGVRLIEGATHADGDRTIRGVAT